MSVPSRFSCGHLFRQFQLLFLLLFRLPFRNSLYPSSLSKKAWISGHRQHARHAQISEEDLAELLPSKRQSTFDNRVAWARTYLDRAGLIETPSRGQYCITEEGKRALFSGQKIDLKYLERYKSFTVFHSVSPGNSGDTSTGTFEEEAEEKSPMEMLDEAFKKVNATLAGELMVEVMKLTPGEFEKLVVKLLLKMGYGSGIDDAGYVTQLSGDGGIDGIIKEDQLGFSSIYIQAKQSLSFRQAYGCLRHHVER